MSNRSTCTSTEVTTVTKFRGWALIGVARQALYGLFIHLTLKEEGVTSNPVTIAGRRVTTVTRRVTKTARDQRQTVKSVAVTRLAGFLRSSREPHPHVIPPAIGLRVVLKVAGSQRVCALVERCWGAKQRTIGAMAGPRDPFLYDKDMSHDEDSEFGFGRGQHPDPRIDFTDDGDKSMIPIADPDHDDQMLTLRMIRRLDINDPNTRLSPYDLGNTDRYGAQPPLVRETKRPKYKRPPKQERKRMERKW